jgi:hypothetical protein
MAIEGRRIDPQHQVVTLPKRLCHRGSQNGLTVQSR